MRWIVTAGVLLIIGLPASFTAGVITALSFSAEVEPSKVLFDALGSAGDWVAGLASFAAAWVALHLADQHRKEDTERLKIEQHFAKQWTLSIVSHGPRPSTIQGIGFYSPLNDTILPAKMFLLSGLADKVPCQLGFGEELRLSTQAGTLFEVATNIERVYGRNIDALQVVILTTIGRFYAPVHEGYREALVDVMPTAKP